MVKAKKNSSVSEKKETKSKARTKAKPLKKKKPSDSKVKKSKEKKKVEKEKVKKKPLAAKSKEVKKEKISKGETLQIKEEEDIGSERYYEAQGRRKTSVARIRIWTKGGKEFLVNKKTLEKYFPMLFLQKTVLSPLEKMKCLDKFKISVIVKGGGISSQAEAIRHGISRALILFNPDFRKRLKKAGFLSRDSRMRERKKFGLKRARRAKQWKKR